MNLHQKGKHPRGFVAHPHPMAARKRGRPAKFAWRNLAVGETAFIPGRTSASLKGCVHHLKPEMRFRFATGVFNGAKGVRVWRVK